MVGSREEVRGWGCSQGGGEGLGMGTRMSGKKYKKQWAPFWKVQGVFFLLLRSTSFSSFSSSTRFTLFGRDEDDLCIRNSKTYLLFVWSNPLLYPWKCPQELQNVERYISCLLPPSCRSFIFCFVPSVLVVKSCTCLFQIPCLLSMHSERVFFNSFFFPNHVTIGSVAAVSRQRLRLFSFQFLQHKKSVW